ncbi:MAG: hypothetical protein EOP21_06730 [Hyphomicrobiales bacterium]|nr:MAG: hypothetical protein EOP21_06730 [Hyphomicrobiales bacterium]
MDREPQVCEGSRQAIHAGDHQNVSLPHVVQRKGKLAAWVEDAGWETVLNRRGTTFRQLPDADKADIDAAKAVRIMAEHTSTIKRPVVEYPGGLLVGFDESEWAGAF